MGFATVVSVLGFGIALVALWLVSDVIKKVETQNEKFVRAHIATLRGELRETESALAKAVKAIKAMDANTENTDKRINDHTKALEDTRARIAKVAEDLSHLDRSIPARYRARVAAPKEAVAQDTAKPKPTMQ